VAVGHLVAGRRREVQADQVTPFGVIRPVAHINSPPRGPPGCSSPWRCPGFIFASRSANLYRERRRRGRAGRMVRTPPEVSNSTSVPSASATCSATALGIRTPRLLPHFWTVVGMTRSIYDVYTGV